MNAANATGLQSYYRVHSLIYDATRWSFLFGRDLILRDVFNTCAEPRRILEVGCGTGKNLETLCQLYPRASIDGLDLSEAMLRIARKKLLPRQERVRWLRQAYERPISAGNPYDLILFSYSLSMFNPGWQTAIDAALDDLGANGCIAVVDFESTRLPWFQKWMRLNHVCMEGHLLPYLKQRCETRVERATSAYGGCWRYFCFIGRKSGPRPSGS